MIGAVTTRHMRVLPEDAGDPQVTEWTVVTRYDWHCPQCNTQNDKDDYLCGWCSWERKDDPWRCACNMVNRWRDRECVCCGSERSE